MGHFLALLSNCAEATEENLTTISYCRTLDASLVPDHPSDFDQGDDVGDWDEEKDATHAAALSNRLSILPKNITGHKI